MEFNRFDVSAKELVWDDPEAWLERLGIVPHGPIEIIDTDITAITAAADKVIRVGDPNPYLVDIELQSSHDANLTRTLWFRHVALDYRHNLPVLTVLVLLRKEANSPSLSGDYQRNLPDGRPMNRYYYDVVRLWKEPAESFLTASVGLVPLAPLTDIAEADLPGVVRRMAERINQEPSPRAAKLWTATFMLMGLRYEDELSRHILEGVQNMRESTTYQSILREGRTEGIEIGEARGEAKEARKLVVRHGTKRFGQPDALTLKTLDSIHNLEHLEELVGRVFKSDVTDWDSLLADL